MASWNNFEFELNFNRMEMHTSLHQIAQKISACQRITPDEGLQLYQQADLHTLGELAHAVRTRMHGRKAYYVINRHINYTNYCVLSCKFCSFHRRHGQSSDGGYELSNEQVVDQARQAAQSGASEVHIVGGLHPDWPFEHYLEMCRQIRAACPAIHIKAFTAIEIIHFTRIARPRLSIRQVLEQLRDAGLDSLPGGGAEIFDERVHREVFQAKVGAAGWFDVHRTAHELGLSSNATMLYGHVETPTERIAHLVKLRDHQDMSLAQGGGRFNCMVPLPFVPAGSELAHLHGPSGLDDLRTLAISRLMLDNFPHVKAFWVMHSPKLAQVALHWGIDDFDGTVAFYDITHQQSNSTRQQLTVEQIRRLIIEAGFEPVLRDSQYREL